MAMASGQRRVSLTIGWLAVALTAVGIMALLERVEAGDLSGIIPVYLATFLTVILLFVVRALVQVPRPRPDREAELNVKPFAWLLGLSPGLIVIGLPIVFVLGGVYVWYVVSRWFRMRESTLMTLAASVQQHGRPLTDVFRPSEFRPPWWAFPPNFLFRYPLKLWYRRQNTFAQDLADGLPTSDAAEHAGILSEQDVQLLRMAELTNSVGRELPRLTAAARGRSVDGQIRTTSPNRRSSARIGPTVYVQIVLIALGLIVGFVMYWIVPKFKVIFEDFGVELPAVTQTLVAAADLFVVTGPVGPSLLAIAVAVSVAVALIARIGPSQLPSWLVRLGPRRWSTPTVLRALATAVEAKSPLEEPFSQLAQRARNGFWAERWRTLAGCVSSGAELSRALVLSEELNYAQSEGLTAAAKTGSEHGQAAFLRATADAIERRIRVWLSWLSTLVTCVLYAGLSIASFYVVVGFFIVIVKLVNDLA